MADMLPSRPRQMMSHQRRALAIVSSEYHVELVQGLVEHAERELAVLIPGVNVSRHQVPGAFEIPLMVQEVAERGGVDAIIALGVIIEGETQHAELIGQAVTRTLMQCSLRYRIPVLSEVLLVRDEEQARRRCLEPELNRGTEAARAAVRMLQSLAELRADSRARGGMHGKTA